MNDFGDLDSASKDGKSGKDIVTEADKEIQDFIIDRVKKNYPEAGVIAEEGNQSGRKDINFIIDPVDGTANLSMSREYFCVSVAFEDENGLKAGGIASPTYRNGLISIAIKDKGAYCRANYNFNLNLESLMAAENRLGANPSEESLEEVLGMVEASSVNDIEDEMSEIRKEVNATYIQPGSAALELVEIARGTLSFRVDAIDVWDYAAGHLIVEEAGGETFSTSYHSESLDRDLDFTVAAQSDGTMQNLMAKISRASSSLDGVDAV